jgi:hypothetical protein
MNKIKKFLLNLWYGLPFGLKAAGDEIMGAGDADQAGTEINQQVSDKRVAKHLLKGEVTQEVEELRYRTYKVARETDNYEYVGHGVAVKKDEEKKEQDIIRFSQENKLICNDVLTELKSVDSYGVEKYTTSINYISPVRFKLQEFLTLIDVVIKKGEKAVTTLHFNDTRNPQVFKSKPFVTELEKLEEMFNRNDTYALSRNDFATSIICMSFTTFKATDRQPDVISYSFVSPELIGVHHENGEFKLIYQWKDYTRIDLTEKFHNAELEEKYKKKEKKNNTVEPLITDEGKYNGDWFNNHWRNVIKCSKCGKDIKTFYEGYINDSKTGKPMCVQCYKKYLLEVVK